MINQSKIKRRKEGEEDYKIEEDDDAQSNSLVVINFAIKSVILAFGCISKMNERLKCDTQASTEESKTQKSHFGKKAAVLWVYVRQQQHRSPYGGREGAEKDCWQMFWTTSKPSPKKRAGKYQDSRA